MRTKSYSGMVEMLYEVESLMLAMKIDPNNLVFLLRAFMKFMESMDKDDGEEAENAVLYIRSLRNFSVKKATK